MTTPAATASQPVAGRVMKPLCDAIASPVSVYGKALAAHLRVEADVNPSAEFVDKLVVFNRAVHDGVAYVIDGAVSLASEISREPAHVGAILAAANCAVDLRPTLGGIDVDGMG